MFSVEVNTADRLLTHVGDCINIHRILSAHLGRAVSARAHGLASRLERDSRRRGNTDRAPAAELQPTDYGYLRSHTFEYVFARFRFDIRLLVAGSLRRTPRRASDKRIILVPQLRINTSKYNTMYSRRT